MWPAASGMDKCKAKEVGCAEMTLAAGWIKVGQSSDDGQVIVSGRMDKYRHWVGVGE